jgi:hypothetical protein
VLDQKGDAGLQDLRPARSSKRSHEDRGGGLSQHSYRGPERAIVSPMPTSLIREFARIRVGFGSNLAVPLTSGGGLLSGVKLKKEDQKLTLGSKVGLLQESGHTPWRPRTAGCSQELTWNCHSDRTPVNPEPGHASAIRSGSA